MSEQISKLQSSKYPETRHLLGKFSHLQVASFFYNLIRYVILGTTYINFFRERKNNNKKHVQYIKGKSLLEVVILPNNRNLIKRHGNERKLASDLSEKVFNL